MIERSIFCPACKKRINLEWDSMYSKSAVQKCDKCGLNFQIIDGNIHLCYEPGMKFNPNTGEKEIIEE